MWVNRGLHGSHFLKKKKNFLSDFYTVKNFIILKIILYHYSPSLHLRRSKKELSEFIVKEMCVSVKPRSFEYFKIIPRWQPFVSKAERCDSNRNKEMIIIFIRNEYSITRMLSMSLCLVITDPMFVGEA